MATIHLLLQRALHRRQFCNGFCQIGYKGGGHGGRANRLEYQTHHMCECTSATARTPGALVIRLDISVVQCAKFPITETESACNTLLLRTLRDGSVHRVLNNLPSQAELFAMLAGQAHF